MKATGRCAFVVQADRREPAAVARLIGHLASDDPGYVTGQAFTMDGGLTMNLGQGA